MYGGNDSEQARNFEHNFGKFGVNSSNIDEIVTSHNSRNGQYVRVY